MISYVRFPRASSGEGGSGTLAGAVGRDGADGVSRVVEACCEKWSPFNDVGIQIFISILFSRSQIAKGLVSAQVKE